MIDLTDRPRLGHYILTRALPPSSLAARWLALHESEQTSHLLYRFPPCPDKAARRRFLSAVDAVSTLVHPHLLPIQQFAFDVGGRPWIVTRYPGDAAGLLTLDRLLRDKGGQLHPDEAERAVEQLLEAVAYGQDQGIWHGPVQMDEVFVDRHGSLAVELYGMGRQLGWGPGAAQQLGGDAEAARDEVRSVVEIGYQLITGIRAEAPLIPAGRLVKKLDRAWETWLAHGLDPSRGFDTPREAIAALPSRRPPETRTPLVNVRSVFERFRPTAR
jgi:hypothetical protein